MNDLNIGNVYSIYKDYREASQMYKKAFNSAKRNGFSDLMMMAFIDLADVYYNEQGLIAPMRDELAALGSDTPPRSHPLTPYTRNVYYGLLSADRGDKMAGRWFEQAKDSVGSIHLGERYAYNADFMISRILQHNGKPAQVRRQAPPDPAGLRDRCKSGCRGYGLSAHGRLLRRSRDVRLGAALQDEISGDERLYLRHPEADRREKPHSLSRTTGINHPDYPHDRGADLPPPHPDLHLRGPRRGDPAHDLDHLQNRQLKSSNEELYKRNRELLALSERDLLAPGRLPEFRQLPRPMPTEMTRSCR